VPRRRDQRGAGVLSTVLGAGVFLAFLLFAVQVLAGLYFRSVVTAATYDAAKAVAGADAVPEGVARADAERNARAQLGDYGRRVAFDWADSTEDLVVVRATAPRPTFIPEALTGPVGLGDVERTVEVRREVLR
jgi:Flp pilus assembly protein TadG